MGVLRAIAAQAGRAIGASLLGSAAAAPTATFMVIGSGPAQPGVMEMMLAFVFLTSLVFTLPCALLIGAPLTWPWRDWITQQPWLATIAYGAVGAIAGRVTTWLTALAGMVEFDFTGWLGATFGALTAIAFVWIIRFTRARMPLDPEMI